MGAYSPLVPSYNTTRYAQPTIQSATPTAWTTGNSPITLWTVTGTIRILNVYGKVGATAFTSTAGTGTLAIGIAASTGQFLAATTANGTTNSIPAGAVNLYIDWVPVSAGATVVSGSP